jgi:hypothetical protein
MATYVRLESGFDRKNAAKRLWAWRKSRIKYRDEQKFELSHYYDTLIIGYRRALKDFFTDD